MTWCFIFGCTWLAPPKMCGLVEFMRTSFVGRLTLISTICAVLTVFMMIRADFFSDSSDKNFIGRWYTKYSYPVKDGKMLVEGTTEYFQNNKYNFVGKFGVYEEIELKSLYYEYSVNLSGDWRSTDKLTFSVGSIRSQIKKIILNNIELSERGASRILGRPFPKLEELIQEGASDSHEIVSIKKEKIVLKADSPIGTAFYIDMKRSDETAAI